MADRVGYIYRRGDATADDLKALLDRMKRGWAWTPAQMYDMDRNQNLLALVDDHEGRASGSDMEVRWRCEGTCYDVLILSLQAVAPAGFEPLHPCAGAQWIISPTTYLLQHGPDRDDASVGATCFRTPSGTIQFVALFNAGNAQGDQK